jgi:hypothetical protein
MFRAQFVQAVMTDAGDKVQPAHLRIAVVRLFCPLPPDHLLQPGRQELLYPLPRLAQVAPGLLLGLQLA